MLTTAPRFLAVVERLAKAVGLRHLERAPRAPFFIGLHRIADQAERDVARELRASWSRLADDIATWNLAGMVSPDQVDALLPRLRRLVGSRIQTDAERAFLRARQAAGAFVSDTEAPTLTKALGSDRPFAKALGPMDLIRSVLGAVDWFLLNPRMVDAARSQATRLTAVETEAIVAAIREAVVTGLEEGLPYDAASALIEGSVGLNDRQAQALGRLVRRLREQGVSPDAIEDAVTRYTDRARAYRAEMIARTEGQAASNGGAFDTYQEGRAQGLLSPSLVKEWIAAPDACPICRALHGQQQELGADFTLPAYRLELPHPPAHPHCRCKFGMAERR